MGIYMKIYDFETKIPLFGQELEFYTLSKVVQFYDGQIHHPDLKYFVCSRQCLNVHAT